MNSQTAKDIMFAAIHHRDFKQSTILAPTEVKLKKSQHQYILTQIKRENQVQTQISPISIYQSSTVNSKYNCLSKFKAYPPLPTRTKNQSQDINARLNHKFDYRTKLTICLCAYNEDKKMLRQSLRGIYDSLDYFEKQAGISSDEIAVVVIFDGIQKLNNGDFSQNIITFFDEVDFLNGSILRQGQISFEDLDEQDYESINQQKWKKISTLPKSQIENHEKRRFRTKYENYMRAKWLVRQCTKKQRTYQEQNLIPQVKRAYEQFVQRYINERKQQQNKIRMKQLQRLKRHKSKQGTFDKEQFSKERQKRQEELLVFNFKKQLEEYKMKKNLIQKAYKNTLRVANKYIASREDTSLVYLLEYKPAISYQQSFNQIKQLESEKQGSCKQLQQKKLLTNQSNNQRFLNVLLVVKHANQGKLSSHALFLLGFCQLMQPQLIMFLDVGLKPQKGSIYNLFQYMDKNKHIGGSCGYMSLKTQRTGDQFGYSSKFDHLDGNTYFLHEKVFSIQKAQLFEYHFGHLIDKPFEAFFDFIHVLPGAFSCYRYSCFHKKTLDEYLQSIMKKNQLQDIQTLNRYLAEDRTLSLLLKKQNYSFAYLPDAKAVVDPASDLVALMGQRKRWINGSWFAFYYVYDRKGQIDDCLTKIQFFYYYLTNGLTYFSISFFFISLFLTFQVLMQQIMTSLNIQEPNYSIISNIVTHVVCFIYISSLGALVYFSTLVKNTDKQFQKQFFQISSFLGLYGLLVTALLLYNVFALISNGWNAPIFNINEGLIPPVVTRAFMIGTIIIFSIQVLFSFSIKIIIQILGSTIHYLFYSATYLHILFIYAFCKIDDLTWGTKGLQNDNTSDFNQQQQKQFKIKKFFHVFKFLGFNLLLGLLGVIAINYNSSKSILIAVFSGIFFLITIIRFTFSILYLIKYYIKKAFIRYSDDEKSENKKKGQRLLQRINEQLQQLKQQEMKQIQKRLQVKLKKDFSSISKIRFKMSKINKK